MKQYHHNHHRPVYKHDPHQGRTLVDVTRAGDLMATLDLAGEPPQALATGHSEYARMAACGALDPGLWRFTARTVERPSVELLVPERQDAVFSADGVVKNGRGGVAEYPTTGAHRSGRSSLVGDGLRPRWHSRGKSA